MKRPSTLFSAVLGAVTSLPVMAIAYLGQTVLNLPFPPFDIFDWIARVLPGGLVTFGIDSMVAVIRGLRLGQISDLAKTGERMMAIAIFIVLSAFFGALLGWFVRRRHRRSLSWSLASGLAAALLILIVRAALEKPGAGLAASGLWLGALMLTWAYSMNYLLQVGPGAMQQEPESPLTRRQFLYLVGGGVVTIGLGSLAVSQLGRGASTSGGGTETPVTLPDLSKTSGPAASPPVEILQGRPAPAPGTRPELTATDDFYHVDINAVPPRVDAENWSLQLEGLVDNPMELTIDDIRSRPSFSQVITLSCISNPIGGDLISTAVWTGIRLKDLLAEAGIQGGAQEIAIQAVDGFYESVPLEEAMDDRTLLVYEMNGEPLPVAHGFPLRIYIPDHYGMKQPKWIERMEVIDHQGAGYWVDRGWSATAIVNTTSVVDTADTRAVDSTDTSLPIGGIAYAGARGISKVEVQIDDGDWIATELIRPPLSPLSWVLWRYDWPSMPGEHIVRVRAYDGNGQLQAVESRGVRPDGATGIDQFNFSVS
ncbi:MAG: molybdopterin-dependent oxidoreductase [Anaerolineales bacterium]